MVHIWKRYAENKANRLRALPVIVPIVFYHGYSSWTVPQVFGEMVQADEDTATFVPSFRYALHDLATGQQALSEDASIRAVLSALRYVQRSDEVTQEILAGILSDLPDGSLLERVVLRYIVERYEVPLDDVTAALITAKDDGGKALMGTIAETWQKQGEALGHEKGFAAGEARGEALGHEKGLAEGEARGEARGETKSLMRLLTKRFGALPEPVAAQIAAASIEEVDLWFDAAITAPTLKSVFGERRDH